MTALPPERGSFTPVFHKMPIIKVIEKITKIVKVGIPGPSGPPGPEIPDGSVTDQFLKWDNEMKIWKLTFIIDEGTW